MKECTICHEEKELSEFSFRKDRNIYRRDCKKCCYNRTKKYVKNNKNKVSNYHKEYREKNKKELKTNRREYYQKNKNEIGKKTQKYYEKNKDKYLDKKTYINKWQNKNRDKVLKYRKKSRDKRKTDPIKKINHSIGHGMRMHVKFNGTSKNGRHWENIVGYTVQNLKEHLEGLFQKGMTWDNHGKWHIDHIIPKSFFKFKSTDDVEFRMCWRLENLQPLWAIDNIKKSNKL